MTWVLEAEHRSSSGKSRETSYDYFYGLRKWIRYIELVDILELDSNNKQNFSV